MYFTPTIQGQNDQSRACANQDPINGRIIHI